MPKTTTDTEKSPRVRGDLLERIRAGHSDPRLRTQQGLGSHSGGVSTRTVARAEDGYASFETVERLALTLGVSPWDLWIPLDADAAVPAAQPSAGDAAAPPAWFVEYQVAQLQANREINEKLDVLLNR